MTQIHRIPAASRLPSRTRYNNTGRYTQDILTYRRYTQSEFKLKFSALFKTYDRKYSEKSKKNFRINIVAWSVLPGVIYRSICPNSSFSRTLKSEKTNSSVYGTLNESLWPKDLTSYRINPNVFKYRQFGESNGLV